MSQQILYPCLVALLNCFNKLLELAYQKIILNYFSEDGLLEKAGDLSQ